MTPQELYDKLENLGLNGCYEILKFEANGPIIFLLDESHDNVNNCIDQNILNAKILISKMNVQIIGVESLAGGVEWDQDTKDYVTNDFNEKWYQEGLKNFRSNCTKFVDELNEYSEKIYGVESSGMSDALHVASQIEERHPLNVLRSEHFIKSLGEEFIKKDDSVNLILNCGFSHNEDIVNFIQEGNIDEKFGRKATYVRINTINNQ